MKCSKPWLIMGLLFTVALAILVGCGTTTPPVRELRSIFPDGTALPANYDNRVIVLQDFAASFTREADKPMDSHYQVYADDVQSTVGGTPDWSAVATRVANNAAAGAKTWLSFNIMDDSFVRPPAGVRNIAHVPSGVPTVVYYTSPSECTDYGLDYGSSTFMDWYDAFVQSGLEYFESNTNVVGYLMELGSSGETINTITDGAACPNGQVEFELQVSCAEYRTWIERAAKQYRAYTAKPLTLSQHEQMCAGYGDLGSAEITLNLSYPFTPTPGPTPTGTRIATATPLYLTYLSKALQASIWDADMGGPAEGKGKLEIGLYRDGIGGAMFANGFGITVAGGNDDQKRGYVDSMVYSAIMHHAEQIMLWPDWLPFITDDVWRAITTTLGTTELTSDVAWIRFHSPEFKKYTSGSTGRTYQDVTGPYTHLAEPVGITPTPACIPIVATQIAANSGGSWTEPPAVCKYVVSGTPEPEDRNTWILAAGSVAGIDIADDWQRASSSALIYNVALKYKDTGTGTITINIPGASVTNTHIITATNTGAWLTDTYSVTAVLDDGFGAYDIQIVPGGAPANLFLLEVTYVGESEPVATLTPSVTPSITPSLTPSVTPSKTPSRTPSPTPSRTPSPTPRPDEVAGLLLNEICPNPNTDLNLDGSGPNPRDRALELFNNQATRVDLAGYTLGFAGPLTYTFPTSSYVQPLGYKVLYGDELALTMPVTGTVTLKNSAGTTLDTVDYGAQTAGACYARVPNATDNWTDNSSQTLGRRN